MGALRPRQGSDFPEGDYRELEEILVRLKYFTEGEARRRLAEILHAGALESGRVRRGGRRRDDGRGVVP